MAYIRENLLYDIHKATALRPGKPGYKQEVMQTLFDVHKTKMEEVDEDKFKSNLEVNKLVDLFCTQLGDNKWWKNSNYTESQLVRKHKPFFNTPIDFSNEDFKQVCPTPSTSDLGSSPDVTPVGLNRKTYYRHAKRVRLAAEELSDNPSEDLMNAAQQDLWCRGQYAASFVLKSVKDDKTLAQRVKKFIKEQAKSDEGNEEVDDDPALDMLALLLERNFSKEDMKAIIQFVFNMTGIKLPCYEKSIIPVKETCRPPITDEIVSDEGDDAQIKMQDVLNHTAMRTLQIPELAKRIEELRPNGEPIKVKQTFKFGMDGLGNLPLVQQGGTMLGKDGNCIGSMLIPLQITTEINGKTEVLHTNVCFNSAQACRPLRIWLAKETPGTNN